MEEITFNDVPKAIGLLLQKIDSLEQTIQKIVNDGTKQHLNTEEAAKFINKTPNALRIMVHHGQIPSYKNKKALYFDRNDLIAWMTKNRQMSEEEREEYARELINQ